VFALDWESHKSLKHDRECLTELLERAFLQPYPMSSEISDFTPCVRAQSEILRIKYAE